MRIPVMKLCAGYVLHGAMMFSLSLNKHAKGQPPILFRSCKRYLI